MADKPIVANVTQTFYDNMASQYDKFYLDWNTAIRDEAKFLSEIFKKNGFDLKARILDCACGIGTQTIGLACLGYSITGSDISSGEIEEAKKRALQNNVTINFKQADFCALSDAFSEKFDIVIAMDNALPHMLTSTALEKAIKSIVNQIKDGGMFVASIRDYDLMLKEKPAHSAPYVHKTDKGQRVLFQTWDWVGDNYKFIQYIIDDEGGGEKATRVSRFECEYRATRRDELTNLLRANGCREVIWELPEKTGFYQPIVIAKK
ncbi:hypothetical protein PIROE2DRAFT_8473 [Piromyces sp. E2]|nr:hypothetical protein PIROE2DRAFT_8473 [Piromyces sp. E2]|eukprot:OUM64706.1 hypothetical protein PIROE2DRAFT_8473 [Piromyces sp. E2]